MGIGALAILKERKTADGERIAALIESCMESTGLLSEPQKWARSRAPLRSAANSLILGRNLLKSGPQIWSVTGMRSGDSWYAHESAPRLFMWACLSYHGPHNRDAHNSVCGLQTLLHQSQKRSAKTDCTMQNATVPRVHSTANILYLDSESRILRLMMYNEYVLTDNLVKIKDQSCLISKARMTMSFHMSSLE